jgi:DMSO reductase family type II enzyme heme b subunit
VKGDGEGAAAYLLYPRPRDFTRANYRLVSTADGVPADEDLLRTITRGMPGSSMPSWAHLPEEDRRALVAYVKSFNPDRFAGEREPIAVPPEPPADAASIERGRAAYVTNCQPCHGPTGKGDGPQKMVDDNERPIRPRDFTRGVFKGDIAGRDLFLRIRAGLPGSPMPSNAGLSASETWDLVHYVKTLIPPGSEERGVQRRQRILARRIEKAPSEPGDPAWSAAAATEIVLMPLSWRDERVETVAVEALHDGKEVAFRLSWRGPRAENVNDFRDGAAVQLATTAEEPSFAMGHAGAPVEILLWQGSDPATAARGPAVDDSTEGFPDLYAAREAGNPIAGAVRPAVTLNEATGFGTLATRPPAGPAKTTGAGVFREGLWQVTIVRPLGKTSPRAADLVPGGTRPVAFAVWQGAFQDRNGQKNVSIWHDLELEK